MRNIGLIIEAIRSLMDGQTSELDDWSATNRSRGNCHVASLVLRHYYPHAVILSGVTQDRELHFWNVLNGVTIDITRDQFPVDTVFSEIRDATSGILPDITEAKRDILLSRVERSLRNQR